MQDDDSSDEKSNKKEDGHWHNKRSLFAAMEELAKLAAEEQ